MPATAATPSSVSAASVWLTIICRTMVNSSTSTTASAVCRASIFTNSIPITSSSVAERKSPRAKASGERSRVRPVSRNKNTAPQTITSRITAAMSSSKARAAFNNRMWAG